MNSITNTFKYVGTMVNQYHSFRIGDVVKVIHPGYVYTTYDSAFQYFTKKREAPYFCSFFEKGEDITTTHFKIKKVAEHGTLGGLLLLYLEDRLHRGLVIGAEGVRLVRQMPLRKKEKLIIEVKTIPQY